MPDINPIEGQVLFDRPPKLDAPLHEIWQRSEPFDRNSELDSTDKRYYKSGNLVVRQYVLHEPEQMEELGWAPLNKEVILKAEEHLAKLQQFGMRVISHLIEPVDPEPASSFDLLSDLAVGYGANPYIPHMLSLDKKEAYKYAKVNATNNHILKPVASYLTWCKQEAEPYILGDIYSSRQYSIHAGDGKVFLSDFDPYMKPATANKSNQCYIDLSISLFNARYL